MKAAKTNDSGGIINERVTKGCEYFIGKRETLQGFFNELRFESDNKAAKKALERSIFKMKHSANVKSACLKISQGGFSVTDYLSTKVKADLNEKETKTGIRGTHSEASSDKTEHPDMFNKLKLWRNKKAAELNIQHYRVIQLATLALIADYLPQTQDELKKIKGMGDKKCSLYGEELLDMLNDYRSLHGIISNRKEEPAKKAHTRAVTLEMFLAGKTVTQISEERELSIATIEGHLAYFIGTGELSISKLGDPDKIRMIMATAEKTGIDRLSPIKEELGDKVSWGDIKFVLGNMKRGAH